MKNRQIPGIILLGFVGLLLLFLPSCRKNDIKEIKRISNQEDSLGIEMAEGVEVTYTDSGVLRAKVFSKVMQHYQAPEPKTEMRDGLSAFFYKNGEEESSLTAGYGVNYEEKKIMEAHQNVIVKNKKGEELSTQKLFWDQNKEKIYTDDFVKIRRENEIIYGNGFESNETFSKYRILQLTGTVSVED